MKLEELEKKYKELGKEIEALKAADKPWPQKGDRYWHISWDGLALPQGWAGDSIDLNRLEIGNCFRTEEEVELEKKRLKVIKKLRDLAGGHKWRNGVADFLLHWNDGNREWYASFDCNAFHPSTVYFPTEEAALNAIDTLGSELDVLREEPGDEGR